MPGLYQRILNSCINYSGNIAWKRIDGPVFIEYFLIKVRQFLQLQRNICWTCCVFCFFVFFRRQMEFLVSIT